MMLKTDVSKKGKDSDGKLYLPIKCTFGSITELTPTEKLFRIRMPNGQNLNHKPGQFVQVSILGLEEAPISISNSPTRGDGTFELAIRRAGVLTGALHRMKSGDSIGIRGPFGSSFPVDTIKGKDLYFISGGCGLAPMRSVIQYCEDNHKDYGKLTVVYGAKSPNDILFKEELKKWEESSEILECYHTVDNIPQGTHYDGNVGLITTLIPPLDIDPANSIAIIVGPPIMYKFVILELRSKGITNNQIIVSLERYMRCGVGKCGHCVIEHKYCCIDGPVFFYSEVENLQGAL